MKNKYNFQEKDRILVFLVIKSELPIGQGKRKKKPRDYISDFQTAGMYVYPVYIIIA